jgi:hypothetical protein
MEQAETGASPKLRAAFIVGAAVMLALWGVSLIPAIENWNNPREDGFSFIPAFYATFIALPIGLVALAGGIYGRGKSVEYARLALIAGACLLVLILLLDIFRRVSAIMDAWQT